MVACQPSSSSTEPIHKPYFDVAGLIAQQVGSLSQTKPRLNKATELDETTDQFVETPDAESWEQELKFFAELDLNQSILLDAYHTESSQQGDTTVLRYTPKQTRRSGVQWLEVYTVNDLPQRVAAATRDKNALYRTGRELRLQLEPAGDTVRITDYQITGFQKMILKDSVSYRIEGVVLYQ